MTELTKSMKKALSEFGENNEAIKPLLLQKISSAMTNEETHKLFDFFKACLQEKQNEIEKLEVSNQDMFTELHAFADNRKFVSAKDQQRWRDGKITIVELVAIGRENMA